MIEVIETDGTVTRPEFGSGNMSVTLTATVTKGDEEVTVITVKEAESTYPAASEGTAAKSSDIAFSEIAFSNSSVTPSWSTLTNGSVDYLYLTSAQGSMQDLVEADSDSTNYTFSGLSADTTANYGDTYVLTYDISLSDYGSSYNSGGAFPSVFFINASFAYNPLYLKNNPL